MAADEFNTAIGKIRNDVVGWGNESVADAVDMMKNRATAIEAGEYGADEIAADWARGFSMLTRDVARLLNMASQSVVAATLLPTGPSAADAPAPEPGDAGGAPGGNGG